MTLQNLPKIQSTISNQILIHPQHAQGTLPVASHTPNLAANLRTKNIFAAVLIFALLLILSGGYFYIPRTKTVMYAQSTAEVFENLSSKISQVNSALDILYKSLTASSAGNDSSLSEIKTNVLAANSSAITSSFVGNSILLTNLATNSVKKQGAVRGFSVPETDPNKTVREQRKLAMNIATKSKDAQLTVNQNLKPLNSDNLPPRAELLQSDLKNLQTKTNEFLTEAEKTSKYYVALSDAAIDIYRISTTITSPKDIENSVSDLTKLRSQFVDYDQKQLPSEIDELNSDIVAIFDLLINFFTLFGNDSQNDPAKLLASYTSLISETRSLGVQTSVHELNFWQNNKILSSYVQLEEEYSVFISNANEVKRKNNYFLLPLLGY